MIRKPPAKLIRQATIQPSLPTLVIEAIRAAIREGQLKSGYRLRERDVGEWLGVSRTPVREAFRILQAQGLLSEARGDGMVITDLDDDEIDELYRTWADLEAISARDAALHATPADLVRLKEIHARWNEQMTPQELGALNRQFHGAMCEAAHNRYLARALDSIEDFLGLLGINTYTVPGRAAEVGREHQAVLNAITRRNPDAAYRAAHAHVAKAGKVRGAVMRHQREHHNQETLR